MKIGRTSLEEKSSYVKRTLADNVLFFAETKAQIRGPSEYIHSGSSLKLACCVILGPQGPDENYARTAVIHWFQEQQLLDPELEVAALEINELWLYWNNDHTEPEVTNISYRPVSK